ncbi:histone-like nucleoid-structuring protein Lsr2 [Arthrobacter sp. ATA002]|uniref:histone-like nucleoid-structuring protein Lsr2 n=1 Tax=Arthrobacter sp. ATA002 TaxID=2991715 RepID=UPI003FA46311
MVQNYMNKEQDHVAQKRQVLLIDDLTGDDAQETVKFALDGAQYEIDLTTEHAAELREKLAPYVSSGRRQRGERRAAALGVKPRRAATTAERSVNGPLPMAISQVHAAESARKFDRRTAPPNSPF